MDYTHITGWGLKVVTSLIVGFSILFIWVELNGPIILQIGLSILAFATVCGFTWLGDRVVETLDKRSQAKIAAAGAALSFDFEASGNSLIDSSIGQLPLLRRHPDSLVQNFLWKGPADRGSCSTSIRTARKLRTWPSASLNELNNWLISLKLGANGLAATND